MKLTVATISNIYLGITSFYRIDKNVFENGVEFIYKAENIDIDDVSRDLIERWLQTLIYKRFNIFDEYVSVDLLGGSVIIKVVMQNVRADEPEPEPEPVLN